MLVNCRMNRIGTKIIWKSKNKVQGLMKDRPGWLSNVSSSSLATTILSLSALSMTNMMACPSLRNKNRSQDTESSHQHEIGSIILNTLTHLLVVMFPQVSVPALTGHVKDSERKTEKKRKHACMY